MLLSIIVGLAASGAVAALAYRFKALSASGTLAAIAVGTILYALGSLAWYGTLIMFFVTSTGWSHWKKRRKQAAERNYEKGGRRDAGQVLANGGLAAFICCLWALWPSEMWWSAFIGVMATVTADTWATEIGSLSKRDPISITRFVRVPRGTSGGVSLLGTIAASAGAATIGIAAWVMLAIEPISLVNRGWQLLAIALVGGVIGAFADSLLGATVQRMNRCTACGAKLEGSEHCGRSTTLDRGWRWMNNDAVNAISSGIGGLSAILIGLFIGS